MRWLLLFSIGCAHGPQPCGPTDSACLETRESKEQVLAKEADREALAFQSRLDRLRAEEEARQAGRTKTASTSSTTALLDAIARLGEDSDSGSSLRALKPTAPEPAPPSPSVAPMAPTPEEYLRGAACILNQDVALLRQLLEAQKRAKAPAVSLGALALAVVEAEDLAEACRAELAHRKLDRVGILCSSSKVQPTLVWLRARWALPTVNVATYRAELGRLRQELELRAGLPGAG